MKYLAAMTFAFVQMMSFSFGQIPLKAFTDKKLFNEISFFGGPSVCSLRGHMSVSNGPLQKKYLKHGFGFGFGVNHFLRAKTNLETLIFYERKGVIIKEKVEYWDFDDQVTANGRLKRDFIYDAYSLNIFIKQTLNEIPAVQVGLGPFVSYLKRSRMHGVVFSEQTNQPVRGYTIDESLYNKKFDAGVSAQILMKLKVTNKLVVAFRVVDNLGVTNTRREKGFSPTKTNSLSFFLGLSIRQPTNQ